METNTNQAIHVHGRQLRARISLPNSRLVRRLILKHLIHSGHLIPHPIAYGGLIIRLFGPE